MELWMPDQIALNDISLKMIGDVEGVARRVDTYRPLPQEVVRRIDDQLIGDRVYNSNAIEGNTLDWRETKTILKQGIAGFEKKREALEARNLGEAVTQLAELVNRDDVYQGSDTFLEMHKTILRDINPNWAGRFREQRVMIHGAKFQPPNHTLVPSLVERVLERLHTDTGDNVVLLATWAHWAVSRIHPFLDGNGRLARLWQDLVLFKGRFTCAIIRLEDRRDYLDALSAADEGDFNLLVRLVAQRISLTFDKYLAELGKDENFDEFVQELVDVDIARTEDSRKLTYMRWVQKVEQLRCEFEACASRITEVSTDVKIQVKRYPFIDQTRWEALRLGQPTTETWFFVVNFYRGKLHRRYCFFFGKHYWVHELDNADDRSEDRVCLLISEFKGDGFANRLDESDDPVISLRQIFLVKDQFVRVRKDRETNSLVYDRKCEPLEIAKDFMKEVILDRLR